MADPNAIARRAVELATVHLESGRDQLTTLADGDMGALRDAARLVQKQAETQPKPALGVEHLAFTLITAAYDALREAAQPEAEG